MHSALLAAMALGAVPVYLYPQPSLPDVSWPTHAAIVVPAGWLQPQHKLFLLEDGRPMLAQIEVLARWPDGSPKWLHAYGLFRYSGGRPAKYALASAAELPAGIPKSPLVVTDDKQGIRVNTGAIEFFVPRPFAGITELTHGGQTLIQGVGGPSVVDGEGTAWHAQHDRQAEITLEQNGPAQVTIKATGWYQTPQPRDDAFCRLTTRFTACANSAIVKIDHATTFADDMKKHTVAELAFTFSLPEATAFSSATLRGKFHDKLRAAFLAQLTDDRLWRIAQTGDDADRDIRSKGDYERSGGWFSAGKGGYRVALLTKDFWQKYPKEVKISPRELVYYAWPKHGELAPPDPEATRIENIYKFRCFHRGNLLDSRLPDEYFAALEEQSDTAECKPEYARAANMQGVSLHNELALAIVPEAADASETDAYLDKLQELYQRSPTARASPVAFAASGVFGPVAVGGQDFADLNRTMVDGTLGFARSIERYGDYGWAIYGNTHHEELMNPAAAGVPGGRPTLHRVWNNDHYKHVSTAWQIWALTGDPRILDCARVFTDNYTSIGQVRYDNKWARGDRHDPELRPSVKYHYPGGFYHCKGLVPWGGRDYGMDKGDVDAYLTGHWPDPSALLFAWLLDANRWAKDGYDLWLSEVKLPKSGWAREGNQNLVQVINAYEYQPSPELLASIKGLAQGLTSAPILQQNPGPLWDPTWLSRYHEMFPDDEAFKKYLLDSADSVGVIAESAWSLALSATAYDLTGDRKYLLRHAGSLDRARRQLVEDPGGRWHHYGLAPGAIRDRYFALQWPRFLAALRKAGITGLEPPDEAGQYLSSVCRFDSPREVEARGTKILFLKPAAEGGSFESLTIQATPVSGGDIQATSLTLIDPAGSIAWNKPRIGISSGGGTKVVRPSTWGVAEEKFLLPPGSGLYTLLVGANEIGIFQPVADRMPECQVLKSAKIKNWSEPVHYRCKLTKGYLVPRTRAPISLRFTALGIRDASCVSITPARGPRGTRWLLAGDSIEIALDRFPAPWGLEVFGDNTSQTEIEITSAVEEPLLYGGKLEDIRLIQEKLGDQAPP